MKIILKFIFLISILMNLIACASNTAGIEISDAWVRPDPLMEHAAGYFIISNTSDSEDTLIGIEVPFAESGALHQSVVENDVHKMLPVDNIIIPPGKSVVFKPMSYHAMIRTLDQGLEIGDTVTFILEFASQGIIEVEAELRPE